MKDGHNFTVLVKALVRRELTIGAAESLTGGLFGYLLTREEGAGDVFRGSLVTYQTAAKHRVLGIETQSIISASTAEEMARSALDRLGSDVAVGLTGVAGPETQEGMPVGTVFVGVIAKGREPDSYRFDFSGDPDQVRHQAAREAAAVAHKIVESLG